MRKRSALTRPRFCRTIFTPKHPQTRPQVEQLLESEKLIDGEGLMKRAIEGIEVLNIKP